MKYIPIKINTIVKYVNTVFKLFLYLVEHLISTWNIFRGAMRGKSSIDNATHGYLRRAALKREGIHLTTGTAMVVSDHVT